MAEQPVQRFYWPEKAIDLHNETCVMDMCMHAATKTSKVPTRMALLFIFSSVVVILVPAIMIFV